MLLLVADAVSCSESGEAAEVRPSEKAPDVDVETVSGSVACMVFVTANVEKVEQF